MIDNKSTFSNTKPGVYQDISHSAKPKLVYSIEELAWMISVYDFSDNNLKEIQRIANYPTKITEGVLKVLMFIFRPTGHSCGATNRGKENNIAIFKVLNDGKLESIGYQTGGK